MFQPISETNHQHVLEAVPFDAHFWSSTLNDSYVSHRSHASTTLKNDEKSRSKASCFFRKLVCCKSTNVVDDTIDTMEYFKEMGGFERVLDRLRFGRIQTGELMQFLRVRLKAEQAYVRTLSELSKWVFTSEIDVANDQADFPSSSSSSSSRSSLSRTLQNVLKNVGHETELHEHVVEAIEDTIENLSSSLEEQERLKAKHKSLVMDSYIKKRNLTSMALKLELNLLKTRQTRESMEKVKTSNMTEEDYESHETNFRKAKQAAALSLLDYKHQVERVEKSHSAWIEDMKSALKAMQALEINRMTCLGDCIKKYIRTLEHTERETVSMHTKLMMEQFGQWTPFTELSVFISSRRTGNIVPSHPRFETSTSELVKGDLNSLLSTSIIMPNAETFESSTEPYLPADYENEWTNPKTRRYPSPPPSLFKDPSNTRMYIK